MAENVEDSPFNEQNIIISKAQIQNLLETYGIKLKINNIDIYRTAFVHRSYCTRKNDNFIEANTHCPPNCVPLQENNSERLEFLGDSVIKLILSNYLYQRYPGENEARYSVIRSKLECRSMLAHLAKLIGLDRYVIISRQIEEGDGRTNKAVLEDAFEAFTGALFLDFNEKKIRNKHLEDMNGIGFQVCERWLINILENNIDFAELVANNGNYKDQLIKYFQRANKGIPQFLEINTETINNKKNFKICVKNQELQILGIGQGESKKIAEQNAAKIALEYLGEL